MSTYNIYYSRVFSFSTHTLPVRVLKYTWPLTTNSWNLINSCTLDSKAETYTESSLHNNLHWAVILLADLHVGGNFAHQQKAAYFPVHRGLWHHRKSGWWVVSCLMQETNTICRQKEWTCRKRNRTKVCKCLF